MKTDYVNTRHEPENDVSRANDEIDTFPASHQGHEEGRGSKPLVRFGGVTDRRLQNLRDPSPDVPSQVDGVADTGASHAGSCVSRPIGLLVPLYLGCYATIMEGSHSFNGTKGIIIWLEHGQDVVPLPPSQPGKPRPKRPPKKGWDSYRVLAREYGWSHGTCDRLYESFVRAIRPCRYQRASNAMRNAFCKRLLACEKHSCETPSQCEILENAANQLLRFWDHIYAVAPPERNGDDPVRAIAAILLCRSNRLHALYSHALRTPVHMRMRQLVEVYASIEAEVGKATMDWIVETIGAGLAVAPNV